MITIKIMISIIMITIIIIITKPMITTTITTLTITITIIITIMKLGAIVALSPQSDQSDLGSSEWLAILRALAHKVSE